jgi:hypothetical protein
MCACMPLLGSNFRALATALRRLDERARALPRRASRQVHMHACRAAAGSASTVDNDKRGDGGRAPWPILVGLLGIKPCRSRRILDTAKACEVHLPWPKCVR